MIAEIIKAIEETAGAYSIRITEIYQGEYMITFILKQPKEAAK